MFLLTLLAAAAVLAVTTARGLVPGKSTIADANRQLGPGTPQGNGRQEHRLADNTGTMIVTANGGGIIEEIEWRFREPVERNAFLTAISMNGLQASAVRDSGGSAVEYFAGRYSLALVHTGPGLDSQLVAVIYMSQSRIDSILGIGSGGAAPPPATPPPAYNPPPTPSPSGDVRTGYNPKECEDVYAWSRQAQVAAEKSKDRKRRQDVLEIRIFSQRGECEASRRLKKEYEQRYP